MLATFLVVLALVAGSCSSPPPAAKDDSHPWKPLFNGRDLDGWDDPAKRTPPGDSWTLADGMIQSRKNPEIREDLMTVEEFGDFELAFDWKISPGGNSGVKYQIQDRILLDRGKLNKSLKKFEEQLGYEIDHPVADRASLVGQGEEYVVGFEYQVIDDAAHPDARRGPLYQAGALYSMSAASQAAAKPVGEFNEARIVKKGTHVEHWLNGVKVVDTQLDAPAILEGISKRWQIVPRVYNGLAKRPRAATPVGLQNHGDEAWFRNIRIRVL